MKCPVEPLVDVGNKCALKGCWMNNDRALGCCMIHDSGHTELTKFDIARIHGIKPRAAQEMIDAGRDKLALWLRLVDAADDIPLNGGCVKCGRVGCAGGKACAHGEKRIQNLSKRVPLTEATEMRAEKWLGLMNNHALLLQQTLRFIGE